MVGVKLAALALLILELAGCSSKANFDQHNTDSPNSSELNLIGTWKIGCTKVENAPFNRKTMMFSGQRFVFISTQYSDAECKVEQMSNELIGNFSVGETINTLGGAEEIDFKDLKLFLTIKSDPHLDAVNQSEWCGGGFVKGVSKELNSHNCADNAELLEHLKDHFSIFKIDGNHLLIGDCKAKASQGLDCSKAGSRPENLQKDVFVRTES